ncbi:hypothetical protein ACWDA3_22225 [Nonomuraea rubra]
MPRFDSPALFARLLDKEAGATSVRGSRFRLAAELPDARDRRCAAGPQWR